MMAIWDLFSKRNKALPDTFEYDVIPQKLRNQIVLWWKSNSLETVNIGYRQRLDGYQWIRQAICVEHGRLYLLHSGARYDEDLINFFLRSQETDILLDIIELSARLVRSRSDPEKQAIEELNHRFRENGVGYEFH